MWLQVNLNMAMVRMIERAGITLDYPIWPFLPSYMDPSPNFKNITFRQLLSHHTGITQGQGDLNITLAEMQQAVESPINISQYNQYLYNNMNFALGRLILPYLYWKQVLKMGTSAIQQKEANQTNLDTELANTFLYFVQNDVFKPAGLANWNQVGATDPSTNSSAMYYSNNFAGFAGVIISPLNDIRNLGSAGFDLSAVELAQITSAARDNKIVSAASMQAIRTGHKNRPLGFNDSATGKYGEYYYKYGGATWNTNGSTGGLATMIVDFHCASANVQVAVVSNENDSEVSSINWIRAAFDNSWK